MVVGAPAQADNVNVFEYVEVPHMLIVTYRAALCFRVPVPQTGDHDIFKYNIIGHVPYDLGVCHSWIATSLKKRFRVGLYDMFYK